MIGFADQLHIAVFDTVVDHFDVVAGAAASHPVAAGLVIASPGCYRLQYGLDRGPGRHITSRHDGWATPCTLLSPGYTGTDIQNAALRQTCYPPLCIGVERIASVNDDISLVEQGQQGIDVGFHNVSRLDHQHNPPG